MNTHPSIVLKEEDTHMPQMNEMDTNVTLRDQLQHEVGPVILINTFTVHPDEADQFLQAWAADAAYFKRQPGFISTQLHRGIGGSTVFVNYAVWESVAQFRMAFGTPEFLEHLKAYPPSAVGSPHL
jgi:heme-degrading monooxygenase HmoA